MTARDPTKSRDEKLRPERTEDETAEWWHDTRAGRPTSAYADGQYSHINLHPRDGDVDEADVEVTPAKDGAMISVAASGEDMKISAGAVLEPEQARMTAQALQEAADQADVYGEDHAEQHSKRARTFLHGHACHDAEAALDSIRSGEPDLDHLLAFRRWMCAADIALEDAYVDAGALDGDLAATPSFRAMDLARQLLSQAVQLENRDVDMSERAERVCEELRATLDRLEGNTGGAPSR
jgi:GNAT superfamily N-acetyltransferase